MQISRAEEPEKWNEQVESKFPHVPAVKRYSDAFIRNNPTLNTAKLCEMLYQALLKRSNVEIKLKSYVSGYSMDK
jgi:hypothetical protein